MGNPIATQLSIDTKALVDRLRSLPPGATVTYSALSAEIGRDVQTEARHSLESARRVLLREQIRFDVRRGEGLQRMSDSEIARSGARSIRLVHQSAKRETRKVAAICDFASLSNEDKIQHNATLSVLGAVAHFSKPSQVKILEAAVAEARQRIPVSDAVETIRRALTPKK